MPVRTCPLCEAMCGLDITLDGDRVVKVRGDEHDVFSKGYLCPKGVALGALHHDPDRVRTPLVRGADGVLHEATWDQALERCAELLEPIVAAGDPDAVGVYLGNPSAHGHTALLYARVLLKALRTKNVFSASTVDQQPKQVAAALMFGSGVLVPVPDVDRTQHLLVLGANPMASNGSLLSAPDLRGRLRRIQERGGKLVVVDPRRTRTAAMADRHVAIRPGGDALWLAALLQVLGEEGLWAPVDEALVAGADEVRALVEPFTPEAVAAATGVDPEVTRQVARDLAAAAPRAAVYGRIGTTAQRFGALASWLVDVLNVAIGALDREGGAMFPLPGHAKAGLGRGRGAKLGRWASRVRGVPEALGELPAAVLAEELDTPGPGQVRALVTVAGNPVLSLPGSERLDAALAGVEAFIALDIYVNETTRHADVLLPAPSPLEKSHYDLALSHFQARDVANWSPALLEGDGLAEWEVLLRLVGIVTGQGAHADVAVIDDFVAADVVRREVGDEGSALHDADPEAVLATVAGRVGPDRLLDVLLRGGAHGLTLDDLEAAPHGIDLGPLRAGRLPRALGTSSGKVELAPAPLVADLDRLHEALDEAPPELVLIGRRDLRSNNSWMHNLDALVRGPERCTAWVHPGDAARLGLADGALACVTSAAGSVEVPVEVTEDVRPGVVSIPHGWGHTGEGLRLGVATTRPGVNCNLLTDPAVLEPLSGTAVLNGVPVTLAPVAAPALA